MHIGGHTSFSAGLLSQADEMMATTLRDEIEMACRAEDLIIGLDYDGTLVDIVDEPAEARLPSSTARLLERLNSIPKTTVAIISGRGLQDLQNVSSLIDSLILVGSHGLEWNDVGRVKDGTTASLAGTSSDKRCRLISMLEPLLTQAPGIRIEEKPYSLALHYRQANQMSREILMRELPDIVATFEDIHQLHGHCVVELSWQQLNKGECVRALRDRVGAEAKIIFIGDDKTDEHAMKALKKGDIGIKVGTHSTAARYQVQDPSEVLRLLQMMLTARQAK